MTTLKLGDKMRVIEIKREIVERSLCCHAPIGFGIRRHGTNLDPDEYDDVCLECGEFCEAAEFERTDDGELIDLETGERFDEGRDMSDDGPDPDAERDARMDR